MGNWSPYVAGANTDHNGDTYIKLAWNPIYLEPATPFRDKMPTWGVKIECEGQCNGLPCAIDPAFHKVNEVEGSTSSAGAGGANFCVVTVPEGSNANFVVFEGGTDEDYDDDDEPGAAQSPSPKSSVTAEPRSSSHPSSSSSTSSSTPVMTASRLGPISTSSTPVASPIPSSTAVSTSTLPSSTSSLVFSSSPLLLPTSPSSSAYTPPILSSASANSTSISSRLVYSSFVHTLKQKQDQRFTDLPAPSFSYKPHVATGNNTASTVGSGATATFPSNETRYSTYPGPIAGSSGAVFNKQITFAGFGLTVLAAVAVVAL